MDFNASSDDIDNRVPDWRNNGTKNAEDYDTLAQARTVLSTLKQVEQWWAPGIQKKLGPISQIWKQWKDLKIYNNCNVHFQKITFRWVTQVKFLISPFEVLSVESGRCSY